mmetsp:Transcript_108312/g.323910  ORF Transcript_108312/g.323910 Transcript_108312/m.323910 type:complete len:226 (+) Transcript_108312:791-1468(+)
MQRAWVQPNPWSLWKSSESRDRDQPLENIVNCPRTITALRTPPRPPATRSTRGLSVPSHRSIEPCQQDRTRCHRQSTWAQDPCQAVASSTADGKSCSSRSSSNRQRRTSSSQRQAARWASRPACFSARWSCARHSMREASSPPRATLPQTCPPSGPRGPRAPFVSSQWSCSHSSRVCWRMPKARSSVGSHNCMLRDTISARASLMTSCSSNCVLSRASSMLTATQ